MNAASATGDKLQRPREQAVIIKEERKNALKTSGHHFASQDNPGRVKMKDEL